MPYFYPSAVKFMIVNRLTSMVQTVTAVKLQLYTDVLVQIVIVSIVTDDSLGFLWQTFNNRLKRYVVI